MRMHDSKSRIYLDCNFLYYGLLENKKTGFGYKIVAYVLIKYDSVLYIVYRLRGEKNCKNVDCMFAVFTRFLNIFILFYLFIFLTEIALHYGMKCILE